MTAYAIRRVLLILPTLFLVSLIVFLAVRFIPGDVIDLMLAEMSEETSVLQQEVTTAHLRQILGLDVPVHIQYGRWLGILPQPDGGFRGAFQGDLGISLWRNAPVTEEILRRLPVSAELGLIAVLSAWIIALPIGVGSAIRQDTIFDYGGRGVVLIFVAAPNFWVATMVIVLPSIWFGWAPSVEYIPLARDPVGNLIQFILPGFLMGMHMSGMIARYARTVMLEVLRQDYIRTAWAKGLTERTVVTRHALRNALIPLVTMMGMELTYVVAGTVVIEQIFCLPGVGRLLLEALNNRDYPVISGINMLVATFVCFMNLVVDLTYGYLDPRVAYK